MLYIDREFINLIIFRKFPIFAKSNCLLGISVQPSTLPSAAGWPNIWGPQDERCQNSIYDLFEMHITAVLYRNSGTALPKGGFFKCNMRDAGTWKWRSEECNNFYRIEILENDAENFVLVEITKLIGLSKRTYQGRARQDLSATCSR